MSVERYQHIRAFVSIFGTRVRSANERGGEGGQEREEEIKEERKEEKTTSLQDFQENVKKNVRSAMLSLTKEIFQTNQSFDSLCSMYLYQMNTINSIRNI